MGEPTADQWLWSKDISSGWLIPDEILIDIISRLPVIDVMRWRCVSKKWKEVTTTLDFIRLHTTRLLPSNPTILVQDEDDVMSNSMQFLDKWWDPMPEKHRFANNFPEEYDSLLSHEGLLVIKNKSDFVIVNPLNSQQEVRIIIQLETNGYIDVFGMFWHPNLKEYCIIFILGPNINTHIVNLGSNPRCREVWNHWDQRIASSSFLLHDNYPVLVGNYLCKEVNLKYGDDYKSILEFDIRTEEFKLITPPLELARIEWYESLNLLNIDGQLSCVRICRNIRISIWTLRDHGSQKWVCCNYNISCQVFPISLYLAAIAFVDGKLIVSDIHRLYICDLKMGTSNNNMDIKCKTFNFHIRHVMSLVSLANCKSEIRLDIGPHSSSF